jgi:hypothetical protein
MAGQGRYGGGAIGGRGRGRGGTGTWGPGQQQSGLLGNPQLQLQLCSGAKEGEEEKEEERGEEGVRWSASQNGSALQAAPPPQH